MDARTQRVSTQAKIQRRTAGRQKNRAVHNAAHRDNKLLAYLRLRASDARQEAKET